MGILVSMCNSPCMYMFPWGVDLPKTKNLYLKFLSSFVCTRSYKELQVDML